MTSKIDIISAAFILLGRAPITDISSSADPIVVGASKLYDIMVPSILTRHDWNFSIASFNLNIVNVTPDVLDWTYEAQLPVDYLKLMRLYPNQNYAIYKDKVYLNQNNTQIIYTSEISESLFPPFFTDYLVFELASRIAMPISQTPEIAQFWFEEAKNARVKALSIDSNMVPNIPIQKDALLAAHYGYPWSRTYR